MESYSFKRKVTSVFGVLAVIVAIIFIVNVALRGTDSTEFGLEYTYSVENDWEQENGEPFDFSDMREYEKDEEGYYCAYYTLPENFNEGTSIIFRSTDCLVELYVDDVFQYETQMTDGLLYNKSPGVRWNVLQIRKDSSEKIIKMRIKPVYDSNRCRVDSIGMGDKAKLVLNIIYNNSLSIFLCFIMILLGVVFLAYSLMMKFYYRKKSKDENDFGLGYLATFAIMAAVWCMIETNIFQLFVQDARLITVVGEIIFVFGVLPLIMYLDNCYDILNNIFTRIICVTNLVFIVVIVALHLFNLVDFHESAKWAVVYYGIIIVIIAWYIIKNTKNYLKDRDFRYYYVLQQIAMICLVGGFSCDIFRYLVHNVTDRAFVTRIGLVCFFLILGIGNIYRAVKIMEYGMKAEFISKLAYTDGLTEVGNRTAYQERLEEIEARYSEKLGVIIFDVNNLKEVNDNLGHEAGDELICAAADLIFESFGECGDVFRIGGDEFAVLLPCENPEEIYEKCEPGFKKRMEKLNKEYIDRFSIVVAHGFACAGEIENDSIHEAIQEADRRMYENKKELKKL